MTRVLLAETFTMMRDGLVALLSTELDIEVVAELQRAADVLPTARRVQPDVAVLDADLRDLDVCSLVTGLGVEPLGCQVVLLAAARNLRTLQLAIDAKVRGLVIKDSSCRQLIDAIRRVDKGEYVIDAELAIGAFVGTTGPLSFRECEVLALAADGLPAREIAARLHLATGTVRNYLAGVIRKLGARNRLDAVRIARERRLI